MNNTYANECDKPFCHFHVIIIANDFFCPLVKLEAFIKRYKPYKYRLVSIKNCALLKFINVLAGVRG